ncbi:MAG: HAMP domain-containing protein, partial [Rhodobacteraceae bacterium]|nr:HAMP domain-containing protein [Paracoccaceae bacterium]
AKIVRQVLQRPNADVLYSDFQPYSVSGNETASFAAVPVRTPGGQVIGAVVIQLSVAQMNTILNHHHGDELQVFSYLVGRDHRLRSDVGFGAADLALTRKSNAKVLGQAFEVEHAVGHEAGLNGAPSVLMTGHIALPGLDMALVMEQQEAELIRPVDGMLRTMLVGVFLSVAGLGLVVFFLARNLARPLKDTAASMAAIAGGDYDQPISGRGRRDEVGDIARALDRFRADLARGAEVARIGAFKGAAFESSSAAMMILDRCFRISYVNPSAMALFTAHADDFRQLVPGFDPATVVGQAVDMFQAASEPIRQLFSGGGHLPYSDEIRIGQARFALEINEVTMEGEGCIGYVLEFRDVTAERMNRAVLG